MSDQHQLYINGEWIKTEASVTNVSPSDTSDVIGHYAQASSSHVDAAITAANAAVIDWGQSVLETRYTVLTAIGNELIARSAELGELLAREEGKRELKGWEKSTGRVSFSIISLQRYIARSMIELNPCGLALRSIRVESLWVS